MPRDLDQALLDGLNRIEDKCDKLTDKCSDIEKRQAVQEERQSIHVKHMEATSKEITEIRKILIGQHEQLVDHVQRSNMLQSQQDQFKAALGDIVEKIKPIEQQRTTASIIEEYEAKKKEKFIQKLTDWKTIIAFVTALGGLVGYIKGWF